MQSLLAITIGIMYAAGLFLILRKSIVKMILGLVAITHASNLLLLWSGGVVAGAPPFITEELTKMTDPLPQALILTAIVISFAILAFFLMLVAKVYQVQNSGDLDDLREEVTEAEQNNSGEDQ